MQRCPADDDDQQHQHRHERQSLGIENALQTDGHTRCDHGEAQ
jgi:hypothetical protein